jgi:ribosomal protein S18 acetylase RimI-like enzyme
MDDLRALDVTDDPTFALVPPCADPGFDHRSCDYWEDESRGSKAARLDWLTPSEPAASGPARTTGSGNPFLDDLTSGGPSANPFALAGSGPARNPFLDGDDDGIVNPFAPPPKRGPAIPATAPRKLKLLGRGLGVVGSYAKVLVDGERTVAYCQFGPLTAYPRAQRIRDLYPSLPVSPLPAVITCISPVATDRGAGHARRLVEAVCEDLAGRGFAAVEAYPELGTRPDATSGATPAFWETVGFVRAIDDTRFPVMRREFA